MAKQEVVERVQNLVRLANDDGTTEEERRSAAVKAVELMRKEKLAIVSLDDLESVRAAVEGTKRDLATMKAEGTQKMLMGGVMGVLLSRFVKF